MARLIMLGPWYPVLSMHLVCCQLWRKASGLYAGDVNGSEPMDVGAALRRLNVAVRQQLRTLPGTFDSIVYLYYGYCTTAAYFDREPTCKPRERVRNALRNLIFLRFWLAWFKASGTSRADHFISMETCSAFIIKDTMLVLYILLHGQQYADQPLATWLLGSDQNEKFNSEMRAFVLTKTEFGMKELVVLIRRWLHQSGSLSDPEVDLPDIFSNLG
jgi:hypothetical protein